MNNEVPFSPTLKLEIGGSWEIHMSGRNMGKSVVLEAAGINGIAIRHNWASLLLGEGVYNPTSGDWVSFDKFFTVADKYNIIDVLNRTHSPDTVELKTANLTNRHITPPVIIMYADIY